MQRTALRSLLGILSITPVLASGATPTDLILVSMAQRTTAGIDSASVTAAGLPAVGLLQYLGRIEYAENGPVAILAPANGRVTGAYAHPGEMVRQGAPVLSVAGPELLIARRALQTAAAMSDVATRRRARDAELLAIGAISQSRLETTIAQAREAESALAGARSSLGSGEFRPDGTLQLRAPTGGHILGPALAPGDAVTAGQVLAYVSDNPKIHASFLVPPTIARGLSPNDAVVTSSSSCESRGRIHAIARNIDSESQSVVVHASLDGAPCFLPGESVTIHIAPTSASNAGFAVPSSAFVTIGPKIYVFKDVGKGFIPIEVDAAAAKAGVARATTITDGTRVVTRGAALLKAEWLKRGAV
jgi:cobalt-zinc-cadmium efflux system membrane fusion protein